MVQKDTLGAIGGLFRYPVKSLRGEALNDAHLNASGVAGDRLWAFRDIARDEITSAKRSPLLLQIAATLLDDSASPRAKLSLPTGEIIHTDTPDCSAIISKYTGRRLLLSALRPASDKAHFARSKTVPANAASDAREVLGLLADEPFPDFSKMPREAMLNATLPGTYFDAAAIHIILASELKQLHNSLPGAGVDAMRFRPNIVLNDLENPLSADDLVGVRIKIGAAVLTGDVLVPRCSMTTHTQGALPKAPEIMRCLVRDWKHNFGVYASVIQAGQIRMGDPVSRLN